MAVTFSRLLLATEHGEFDAGAEALAFEMARRCGLPLAGVLPIVGNPEYEVVAPELAARADAEAAARREKVEALAQRHAVTLDLRARHGLEPYVEIVEEARERAADLIVIRRRGRRGFLANLLVGDMVSKVIAHAPCSVLVAPRGAKMWTRRVLVGIDPQAPDVALLAAAAGVAVECGLPLHVLCVVAGEADRAAGLSALEALLLQGRSLGATCDGTVRLGRPHQELIAAAQATGADLLVVGRHAGTVLTRAWIGGTAQKVIGLAECPVLVHVPSPSR